MEPSELRYALEDWIAHGFKETTIPCPLRLVFERRTSKDGYKELKVTKSEHIVNGLVKEIPVRD